MENWVGGLSLRLYIKLNNDYFLIWPVFWFLLIKEDHRIHQDGIGGRFLENVGHNHQHLSHRELFKLFNSLLITLWFVIYDQNQDVKDESILSFGWSLFINNSLRGSHWFMYQRLSIFYVITKLRNNAWPPYCSKARRLKPVF